MTVEVDELFRREVADARKARVEGEIVLSQPIRTYVLVFFLFSLAGVLGLWLGLIALAAWLRELRIIPRGAPENERLGPSQ